MKECKVSKTTKLIEINLTIDVSTFNFVRKGLLELGINYFVHEKAGQFPNYKTKFTLQRNIMDINDISSHLVRIDDQFDGSF